jgi:hypothetical protein
MPIQVPIFDKVSGLIADIWRRWFAEAATAIGVSAPVDAQYLTATADPTLTAPRNLGLLTSGYLKVAVALAIATPSTVATIPATDLSGTIPDARLSANVPLLNAANTFTNAGTTGFGGPVRLKGYTVATLPAGVQGQLAFATDLLAPTYLGAAVGGGAVVGPIFYDGANWVSI